MSPDRKRHRSAADGVRGRSAFQPFLIANLILLAAALLMGGASRENLWLATSVELIALAMFPWAVFRLVEFSNFRTLAWPLAIILLIALVPLVQIVPLPAGLWTKLSWGQRILGIYSVAGIPPGPHPLSLTPDLTIRSALALIPALAVFLGCAALSDRERRLGVVVILFVALASLLLGALQLTGGSSSRAYLYENTNSDSLVGFFSNRNHQAALLLCSLPFAAAIMTTFRQDVISRTTLMILSLGLTIAVVGALAAVRSRAGILLLGPALAGGMLVLFSKRHFGKFRYIVLGIGAVLICAIALVVWLGLGPLVARFQSNFDTDARFTVAPDIWHAALAHFTTGTGLGSFDSVYRSIERLDLVTPRFLNHAHNDYLELLLEVGFAALPIFTLFVGWFSVVTWKAWRAGTVLGDVLARAASVVIALLLAHSLVDYPLRTIALSSVFGFACGLLVPSVGRE